MLYCNRCSCERLDQEDPHQWHQQTAGHPWHAESWVEFTLHINHPGPNLCWGQAHHWEVLQSSNGRAHLDSYGRCTRFQEACQNAAAAHCRTEHGREACSHSLSPLPICKRRCVRKFLLPLISSLSWTFNQRTEI